MVAIAVVKVNEIIGTYWSLK